MHAYPSRFILFQLITSFYQQNEQFITSEMVKLRGSTISLDHTFKVSSNVGLFHLNKWSIQYDSLFLVLNESGQVLAWQLTRGTSFKQVYTLIKNVYYRDTEKTKEIYIDNCCLWRKKLQFIFGTSVRIKLDLFHAIKRFTKELPKYSTSKVLRKQCKEDFRLIFRENNDFGKDRLKAMPTKEKMIEKLEHFRRAWLGVEHNSKPFICKDAIKALDNLEIHILKGCLENIPPKTGTSRNESLHRQLNNIINIPKCSVELIVSILGSFFINGMLITVKQMQLSIFHSYQNMKKRKRILKHLELAYLSLKSRILKKMTNCQ